MTFFLGGGEEETMIISDHYEQKMYLFMYLFI